LDRVLPARLAEALAAKIGLLGNLADQNDRKLVGAGIGGPLNSSKTIVYYLYEQAFGNLEISYACTIGLVLFLIILILSVLRLIVNQQDGNDFNV
jgi:ABC-type phosphate transport system permease subunit